MIPPTDPTDNSLDLQPAGHIVDPTNIIDVVARFVAEQFATRDERIDRLADEMTNLDDDVIEMRRTVDMLVGRSIRQEHQALTERNDVLRAAVNMGITPSELITARKLLTGRTSTEAEVTDDAADRTD